MPFTRRLSIARKPLAQKHVFQRRYTYLPGEDILIWKVSNTAMGLFVQINGKVCAHLWPSICTYFIGGLERGCSGFP